MTTNDPDNQERVDYTDEDTLRRLYYDEEQSTNDIAEMAGVTGGTIRNWMDCFDMDRRDRGEAAAMKNRVEYAQYVTDKDGYPVWKSWSGDSVTRLPVHHLMLVADGHDPHDVFSDDTEGHHKRPVPWLNTPDNLELLSTFDHQSHHNTGEAHDRAKLSNSDVREIRERMAAGETSFDLADEFGVSPSTIRYAKRGDNWSHVE